MCSSISRGPEAWSSHPAVSGVSLELASGRVVKVLIDKGDDDGDNDTGAVANVNAQGNVKIGTSNTASVTGSSGFSPFVLMDLNKSVMDEIKGKNHRKFLNNLRRDYYNKDELWVKRLHL